MEAINGLLLRWTAASNATNEEVRIKRHTVFKQGLSSSTRTFMDLQNITNAELIFNRILETENNLKMRKEDSNPKQTQEYFLLKSHRFTKTHYQPINNYSKKGYMNRKTIYTASIIKGWDILQKSARNFFKRTKKTTLQRTTLTTILYARSKKHRSK